VRRDVTARLVLEVDGPVRLAAAIGVAANYDARERFTATLDGREVPFRVAEDLHRGRLHLIDVTAGTVELQYSAIIEGTAAPLQLDPVDELRYLRPSRYCESDILRPTALGEFRGLQGAELLAAVSSWVGVRLRYRVGSSLPTDGAVRTLLNREGVCRDYAHLVVAFLRALDVPARVVAVYAPGLKPMDFHAVAEALIDGTWQVVDATIMAPRSSLVRIATGRDAADTAFLSSHGADVQLSWLEVSATVDELPGDDVLALAVLE
jgi:transglutaminase-like putative cysteine protease